MKFSYRLIEEDSLKVCFTGSRRESLISLWRRVFPFVPVKVFYSVLSEGRITVNGEVASAPSLKVSPGDEVCSVLRGTVVDGEVALYMRLDVVAEEEDYLVVVKPPGVAVHGGVNDPFSLYNGLLYLMGAKSRVNLVHRLDKPVGGLLVVAKSSRAAREFVEMFAARRVEKRYLALVAGVVEEDGIVRGRIEGKESLTRYRVVESFPPYTTLLEVFPATGRFHQIRVHMKVMGCPVVGDRKYGNFSFNKFFKREFGFKHLFLFCHRLSFEWKGEEREYEVALPEDMRATLQRLRERCGRADS